MCKTIETTTLIVLDTLIEDYLSEVVADTASLCYRFYIFYIF